jgi:hypothetical protein
MSQHAGLSAALIYLSVPVILSSLPAILAFWKGQGPWTIWALAFAILSPVSFILWTAIAGAFGGSFVITWGPTLGSWFLAWIFAWIAIRERQQTEN